MTTRRPFLRLCCASLLGLAAAGVVSLPAAAATALAPQQRLFFTLEAMGLTEKFHDKVFGAMHVERLRLNSDEQVMDYLVGKARQ